MNLGADIAAAVNPLMVEWVPVVYAAAVYPMNISVKQAVDRVTGLGEVPVLGALFRSSEFQGDRSELMFVITPRLIKPLDPNYILPTDSFTPPNRSEFYFGNKLEGSGHPEIPADPRNAPANAAPINAIGGMEVK